MITLYSISPYSSPYSPFKITEHQYDRVTDHFAVRTGAGREIRDKLHTDYQQLFPTAQQAIEHRRGILLQSVEKCLKALKTSEGRLQEFELKFPTSSVSDSPASEGPSR